MTKRCWTVAVTALLTGLSGCAAFTVPGIQPGSSAAEVRAKAGAPSDERQLGGGGRAWDYVGGPQGFTTHRVSFDDNNRVRAVEQLLTERRFMMIRAGESTRENVAELMGRPGSTMRFSNLNSEVWTYRYRDVTLEMLGDVHFDARTGKVLYYSLYRDPAYTSAISQ
jgi:outer membrane protein assembly factor BamE (lipoprotein component of BamABCDE complex)